MHTPSLASSVQLAGTHRYAPTATSATLNVSPVSHADLASTWFSGSSSTGSFCAREGPNIAGASVAFAQKSQLEGAQDEEQSVSG